MRSISEVIGPLMERVETMAVEAKERRLERLRVNGWPETVECSWCGDTGTTPEGADCFCERGETLNQRKTLQATISLRLSRAGIPTAYRDSHWEYAENYRACELVREWAENRTPGDLLLLGAVGRGKSSLACLALVDRIHQGATGRFISQREFADSLFFPASEQTLYAAAVSCPIIVFDDIGATHPSEFVKTKTAEVIELRWERKLPTIVTTNLSREGMEDFLGVRATSRLMSPPVTQVIV